MRHASLALGLSIGFVFFAAAIAANIGGNQMPEMRGAWVAQAVR
jgi:hypothetical protein